MTSEIGKFAETLVEDGQKDLLSSAEDKHLSVTNNKAECEIQLSSNIKNITEDLLTIETEKNNTRTEELVAQSSLAKTIEPMNCVTDNDKKNAEFSNSDIVVINNDNGQECNVSNVDPAIENNDNQTGSINAFVKQYDADIDNHLPETVTLLRTPDGGKLYLVGTAHFSVESQNDVSEIIQAVQPHIVVVELCKARVGILKLDEKVMYRYAQDLNFKCIQGIFKEYGVYNGLINILLFKMIAHITKELGLAPGGEFRRAFQEAKKVPYCMLHMGDRPINITITRALRFLSWWQTIKLAWHLIMIRDPISKEDIELCKQRAYLDEMLVKMSVEFPVLGEVFVKERDIYLTYSLQLACAPQCTYDGLGPARVVGVVGLGHIAGIVENWCKVKPSDIPPIMSIPPLSLSTKILQFTFKASLVSAIIYVGYKIIPLASIKSSVQGLLKNLSSFFGFYIDINLCMNINHCIDAYTHDIAGIMYVPNNIPGPGINVDDFESIYTSGCSCILECSECACTRGSVNYVNDCIVEEKLSVPILECNSQCTCNQNCGNRLVQYGPLNNLQVANVGEKGFGLITTKMIRKGQFICEYAGEVISIDEARYRVEANKNDGSMNYVLVVSEHIGEEIIVTCIDPKYFGNIGRYCNHSCQPNTNLVPVRVESAVPRLCLFASRNIESEEEITFNYASGVVNSVHHLSDKPCLCGSSNCLGYLPNNPI